MVETTATMTSRTRLFVLLVSAPVIAFAVVGGVLGKALTTEGTYRHLAVFQEVVSLVLNNYVEEVKLDKVMQGAMHGLTEALDPDSSYVPRDRVRLVEEPGARPEGEVGLELTRQYYLRVVSAIDGSPAARAGIMSGDYIRAIGDRSTRDMPVFEGMHLLRGEPGSTLKLLVIRGNAAEPHEVELVRERLTAPAVTGRSLSPEVGYLRLPDVRANSVGEVAEQARKLEKNGAKHLIMDIRGAARGEIAHGLDLARLFIQRGALAIRESQERGREPLTASNAGATVALPVVLLVDSGTSGAAEVFAAAMSGNKRAELVGEKTQGRATEQELIKLPDGSALLLSTQWYSTPAGQPITGQGLTPDLEVETPDVEFGAEAPTPDVVLDRALEYLSTRLRQAA
jgi:carboxyl-terminal processing protease